MLGSLLEKQRTVPASYPLTLNSLRTACNQSNSRDPVSDYDEPDAPGRVKSLQGTRAACGSSGPTVGRGR